MTCGNVLCPVYIIHSRAVRAGNRAHSRTRAARGLWPSKVGFISSFSRTQWKFTLLPLSPHVSLPLSLSLHGSYSLFSQYVCTQPEMRTIHMSHSVSTRTQVDFVLFCSVRLSASWFFHRRLTQCAKETTMKKWMREKKTAFTTILADISGIYAEHITLITKIIYYYVYGGFTSSTIHWYIIVILPPFGCSWYSVFACNDVKLVAFSDDEHLYMRRKPMTHTLCAY